MLRAEALVKRTVEDKPERRSADEVMRARRLGAFFSSPLSPTRAVMRNLLRRGWSIERVVWSIDAEGRGRALYRTSADAGAFHFLVISDAVPEQEKTDRSIGTRWDVCGALCEGAWTKRREASIARELPKQKWGRADADTLVWARGNRSARLFDHVVDSLAAGRQPNAAVLGPVGYILRTTGFFANGRLGMMPFDGFADDHPLRHPFHAQIFAAFMLREFTSDLVEHMAAARDPRAVKLAPEFRRYIGIGNSAGLGLVPFVVNHPHLVHDWLHAQETALAHAFSRPVSMAGAEIGRMEGLLKRAIAYFDEYGKDHGGHFTDEGTLARELEAALRLVEGFRRTGTVDGAPTDRPWWHIERWLHAHADVETQGVFHTLVLETYDDIVDIYEIRETSAERFDVVPQMPVSELRSLIEEKYGWALALGSGADNPNRYFWYRSEEAFEPRMGVVGEEPGEEHEMPMGIVREVTALHRHLAESGENQTTAEFLIGRPHLRWIVERVQSLHELEYAEVRDNYLAADFVPLHMIRFVLALYGLERFDPRSTRWVRGTLLQGAPSAADLAAGRDGEWPFPLLPLESVQGGADSSWSDADKVAPRVVTHRVEVVNPARQMGTVALTSRELRSLVDAALIALGSPRGWSRAAAAMVDFAEIMWRAGLDGLEDHLETDVGDCARIFTAFARASGAWTCDAAGAGALLIGPPALDLACAAAHGSKNGVGSFVGHNLCGPHLLGQLALQGAVRGLATAVLWTAGNERTSRLGRGRMVFAVPTDSGPFLVDVPLQDVGGGIESVDRGAAEPDGLDFSQVIGEIRSVSLFSFTEMLKTLHGAMARKRPGSDFFILCRHFGDTPPSLDDYRAALTAFAHNRQGRCLTADDYLDLSKKAQRGGINAKKSLVQHLANLDARTLVPTSKASRLGAGE